MVGPVPEGERRSFSRLLGVELVALVTLSAGLMAFYGDATPAEPAIAVLAGLLVSAVLLVVLGRY